MRRGRGLATLGSILLLAACKPKPAPVADAGALPVDAAVVVESPDAAPEAAAPPPAEEDAPAEATFSEVATLPRTVRLVHGIRLTDGIAISETNDAAFSIYTVGKSKPLANLTEKLKSRAGDAAWIWGTTDEIWATTGGGWTVHATRAGEPEKTKLYRHVVPFTGTQWLGIKSKYPLFYLTDEQPNVFEQLRGADAKAEVPLVPKNIQLWTLASLGEGRLCGVGIQQGGDGGADDYRLWWGSSATNTKVIQTPTAVIGGGYVKAFKGPNGDCIYVYGEQELAVRRLRGNHVVPVMDDIANGVYDATNTGNALWVTQDGARAVRRIDLTKSPPATKTYALPKRFEGCTVDGADGLAAVADDDIWLVARCKEGHDVLLHTEPPGAAIEKIAPP